MFSAAAVTTSFLGAQALHGEKETLISWLALGAFAGVASAYLAILWPRRWEVTVNPHVVIESCIEAIDAASIEDLHRELSFHMYRSYLDNREELGKLVVFAQIANVLFAAELTLWIVAIAFS